MIVPMTRYDLVVYRGDKDTFLDRLQDLGLVDITVTDWEPNERQREAMISIDKHRIAVTRLREMDKAKDFKPGKPYSDPEEAWRAYREASARLDELDAGIAAARREAEDLSVWGEFDPEKISELESAGLKLHFFHVFTKEFETRKKEWAEQWDIIPVIEQGGTTYFVVITAPDEEVAINAQELRAPETTSARKNAEAEELEKQRVEWEGVMARAAASVDMIEEHGRQEQQILDFEKVAGAGKEEAEGSLVIMEGWAPSEVAEKVDRLLDDSPNLFYIKGRPTPQDDTPTMLKNKKPSRMFEIIGSFYSQPKYDTMDLTAWFGPFYAIFFGLCLADAGYGLLYFIIGLVMLAKTRSRPQFRSLATLVTILGFSTMVCGTLMDSFFGMKLTGWAPLAWLGDYLIADHMFNISLGIGTVQILLAMCLKVYMYTRKYGFKYALSSIGWMIVIVTAILPVLAGMLHIELPEWITVWSPVRLALTGIGLFMMLFLNSPGKNPLVNFGSGLWNTYNDVVGFISDFLSYIRLFAIGLSGGILAMVFNMLADGMSGDIVVLKQIIMVIILLIGHGLTLFMSTISSFVHPMRLTFVEFYKNAGFEDTQRIFTPFKKNRKN